MVQLISKSDSDVLMFKHDSECFTQVPQHQMRKSAPLPCLLSIYKIYMHENEYTSRLLDIVVWHKNINSYFTGIDSGPYIMWDTGLAGDKGITCTVEQKPLITTYKRVH